MYAKDTKEIRKQKKKKKKGKEKNMKMDPGEPFRPRSEKEPAAHLVFPEMVSRFSPCLTDRWDPITRVIPNLSPISLEMETVARITPR
jgi:hypothetical protein